MRENSIDKLFQQLVYAVSQAISVDAPRERAEHRLETNNRQRLLVGDLINDNLRHQVVSDTVELIGFNRSAWEGRLIADHSSSTTYTIIKMKTLKQAVRKQRNVPYYLQAILVNQNQGLVAEPKQMTLADICNDITLSVFSREEYDDTYISMFGENAEKIKDYKHYVVAYEAEGSELQTIGMYLFDQDFDIVEFKDLSEYRKPDFAALTGYRSEEEKEEVSKTGISRSAGLVKLKPQIKERKKA